MENKDFISKRGFNARKQYYIDNPTLLKAPIADENAVQQDDMLNNMLKSQIPGMLPLIVLGSLVSRIFANTVAGIALQLQSYSKSSDIRFLINIWQCPSVRHMG